MHKRRLLVVAATAVVVGTVLTWAITASGSKRSADRKVSFVAHFLGPTNFVDNPPPQHGSTPGPGDLLTAESRVLKTGSRRRVGRTSELCIGTVSNPFTMQCDVSLLLKRGELLVSGSIDPSKHPWSAPVVGGTGRYAGARGTVLDRALKHHNERLVFRLTG